MQREVNRLMVELLLTDAEPVAEQDRSGDVMAGFDPDDQFGVQRTGEPFQHGEGRGGAAGLEPCHR